MTTINGRMLTTDHKSYALDSNISRWQRALKRGCTLIFSILWYTFWPKISKTSKIPKNDFHLIKSHQNQFFRAKRGSKGPNLGFGQITIGKSQFFSKVKKVTFFDPIGVKIGQNVVRGQLFWLRPSNQPIFGVFGAFWTFLLFLTPFGNGQIYLSPPLIKPDFSPES